MYDYFKQDLCFSIVFPWFSHFPLPRPMATHDPFARSSDKGTANDTTDATATAEGDAGDAGDAGDERRATKRARQSSKTKGAGWARDGTGNGAVGMGRIQGIRESTRDRSWDPCEAWDSHMSTHVKRLGIFKELRKARWHQSSITINDINECFLDLLRDSGAS